MSGLEPYGPPGFDDFWLETLKEAQSRPVDFSLSEQASVVAPDHRILILGFKGADGTQRHGWIAVPKTGSGPYPGFLWLPPYSRWSMLPNEYGTRPGYVSLSFNFFGEAPFHREDYKPERGYFAEGVADKSTWVFRRMFQDAAIAQQVLENLPMVDPNQIAAAGMSQGGGIAIWLAAYEPKVKAVVADMPFLAGMPWVLGSNVYRYPLKELTDVAFASSRSEAEVRATLAYFDTINLATRCKAPTRLTLGLRDPAVKPEQVRAVFNALAGEKELQEIDWGHDWHPEMVTGAKDWLDRWLSGPRSQ